jgi:hypothetical protein
MLTAIFEKTDKGREEMATRKHQLSLRMRSLLLLVDGKQNGEELLSKVSGAGLDAESLGELLREGYVYLILESDPEPDHTGAAMGAIPLGIAETVLGPEQQLQQIRDFYRSTIKSHLSLFEYPLQLKAERARTLEELYALRAPYLRAIFGAKGEEFARELRDKLDLLFHNGPT